MKTHEKSLQTSCSWSHWISAKPLTWAALATAAFMLACGPSGQTGTGGRGGTAGSGGSAGSSGSGPQFKPKDCQNTYGLYAHGGTGESDTTPFPVPVRDDNLGNTYQCFYFDPPHPEGAQGLWFYPDLSRGDLRFIHHFILYASDKRTHTSGTSERCTAIQAGAYFVAGWAPGASETNYPNDVGILLPPKAVGQYILEVHYANYGKVEGATDASGFQFCTAPAGIRPHTASVQFTGTDGICVPPNGEFTARGPCDPRDDEGDIHIIGWSPHAHLTADHMKTTITRKNGNVEVLHDAPFDFNFQRSYAPPAGEVVLRPGDTISTDCHYRNPTAVPIHFGEKTQDEMCYNFVVAWPAKALAIDPAGLNDFERGALDAQQERRCVKPLSILDSCNGLRDLPTP
jgi:hypothetical protein